jgi:hypothetical protein
MTVGASGTYSIQGTDLSLQPTTGDWVERDTLGIDGGGHPIYPAGRSFELTWQLINASDLSQVISFYNQVQNTGTVAVDLPAWGLAPYQFVRYSGCTLGEPEVGQYFTDHTQEIRLLIYNVQT